MAFHVKGRRGCTARKKDGSGFCNAPAVMGTGKCRVHGGTVLRDRFRHGLYAQYQPPAIQALIDEQRNNPQLMDMREQVAVVSGLLAHAFERLKQKEQTSDQDIATLLVLSTRMSELIERYAKVGVMVRVLVHLETIEQLIGEWAGIAADFIPPSKREEFAKRLALRAAQLVGTVADSAMAHKYGPAFHEIREMRKAGSVLVEPVRPQPGN